MKKLSIPKKIILGLVLSLVLLIGSISIYINSLSSKINRVEVDKNFITDTGQELPKESEKVITIALIGSDYEDYNDENSIGNTDTMMILSIDKNNNNIKLCSLMRDTYVDFPDGGKVNLNYAVHDGGIASTIRTINYNFNLKIDKFVHVNLYNLPSVIDTLGGVELTITEQERGLINSYLKGINAKNGTSVSDVPTSGKVLLNGSQAAAFCRIRYTEGKDYKRTERQRDVLEALFNKVKTVTLIEVPGIINKLLPLVSTNLSDSDILSIASKVLSMDLGSIEQGRFPLDGHHTTVWTDMYHIVIDKEQTTNDIHNFIYGTTPAE